MTDDILIRFSVKDDARPVIEKLNQKLGQTKQQSTALVPGLESARRSMTGFVSDNAALIGVLAGVGLAIGKVVKDHIAYANAVRQQMALSGENAENASRFIQVLDDYKLTTDDALAATRALTKEGHAPNIETLAKLSDQYLAINGVEEKNEFILKNLGRGGAAWTEVLQMGSKALLEQGDAVADNLILTQKMVDDARRAEIAMNSWNDTVAGLKTQFATGLLPELTKGINYIMAMDRALELTRGKGLQGLPGSEGWNAAMKQALSEQEAMNEAMLKSADAADTAASSTAGLADSQKAAQDAARALSDVYTGLLSSMFAINQQQEDHRKTLEDLAKKDGELADEKSRLTLQMWEEQRAGKLTNDENLKYIQKMDEITKAQEENRQAKEDATQENEKASKQRIYDLVQEKLGIDGVIDTGEYEYLQNLAVQKGLVSRAAADQAIKENQLADSLVSNFNKTQPAMSKTLSTMQQIAGYNGVVVDFGVNFSTSGSLGSAGSGGGGGGNSNFSQSFLPGQGSPMPIPNGSRDSGGYGMAGTPYMIGTGAQPEMFIPSTNGTFKPNAGGMGNTYNITINNPKVEKSENSIRTALKKLSFVGVAA
jgi:hypothetical protein